MTKPTVFIIEDDNDLRNALSLLLEAVDQPSKLFSSATEFLAFFKLELHGCLILDVRLPRMTGLKLQQELEALGSSLPIIFLTAHGDIPMAVEAMRHGALDFINKPFREQDLLDRINEALDLDAQNRLQNQKDQELLNRINSLSQREKDVFMRVVEGNMNKRIAYELSISERTVEFHRSSVLKKLNVRTLTQLVRMKVNYEQILSRKH